MQCRKPSIRGIGAARRVQYWRNAPCRRSGRRSRSSPPGVNVALRDALLEVVDNQLAANDSLTSEPRIRSAAE